MSKGILLRSYDLLDLRSFKWLFCFAGPVLSFIYILTEQPYGFSWFSTEELIQLSLYYSAPVSGIWALHLFVLQPLLVKESNVLSTFLMLVWVHVVITMYVYSFSEVYIFDSQFDWYFLPETFKLVFQMGAVLTFVLILIHFFFSIRKKKMNT